MASCFQCPICFSDYALDQPLDQAVGLACGHTFCRRCLTGLPAPKLCPNDRQAIQGDVARLPPNYSIHEAIAQALAEAASHAHPAPDPLDVPGAATLLLPAEDLVLGEVLGQGATSVVHRGTLKGQQVAVKVMQLGTDNAADPMVIALRQEMIIMLQGLTLCHHVCRYLGVVEIGRKFCIVMQLYKESLKACIDRQPGGKMSLSAAMPLAMAVARGLEELHSRHIIACDLKPDNILLTETEHAVIADFGISRVVSTTVGCVRPTNAQGTENYMAPEQMYGAGEGEVSCKSDMWAFACTFIHMLTGKPPLYACNKMQIMRMVTVTKTPHPIPSGLPLALTTLLESCLSYDSDSRPSALELVSTLREVQIQQQDLVSTHVSELKARIAAMQLSEEVAAQLAQRQIAAAQAGAETRAPLVRIEFAEHAGSDGKHFVVVAITSNSLAELLNLVNSTTCPTVFDLGGRRLQASGSQSVYIDTSDVTLRNGTIVLESSQAEKGSSFGVRGSGVQMSNLTIVGGHVGLWVRPGSAVQLQGCEIRGAHIGVWVGSTDLTATCDGQEPLAPSELLAVNLTISGCGKGSALTVGRGGSATLNTCSVSGGQGHGILVWGDSPSRLSAKRLVCSGNEGKGVIVHSGASVELTACSLTGNKEGSLMVRGVGSQALLADCTLEPMPASCEGGVFSLR